MARKSKYQRLTAEHPLANQTNEPAFMTITKAQYAYIEDVLFWSRLHDLKVGALAATTLGGDFDQEVYDRLEGEANAFYHGLMERLIAQAEWKKGGQP